MPGMRYMRPVIRFVLWLLIAVLPLQGGASSLLPCMQLSAPLAHNAHCATLMQDASVGDHEKQNPANSPHAKCTHCTACPSASGVPAASHGLLAVLLGRAVLPAESAINDHIPAALERPPQTA